MKLLEKCLECEKQLVVDMDDQSFLQQREGSVAHFFFFLLAYFILGKERQAHVVMK